MLQPELKLRRDKIRSLMVSQGIDAALITCNANLIYTYGCVVSGYLYLPLHSPALLFFKRPNNITGEHSFPIRKPEQIVDILKEKGLPLPTKLMLEGDELPYTEYVRLAGLFPDAEVVNGTPLIRQARSVKTAIEIEMFRRSGMGACQGIRTDSVRILPWNDRYRVLDRNRTSDASSRLPRHLPRVWPQHGNLHGKCADRR